MGLSHSWIAVKGASREAALQSLGMEADREIGDGFPRKVGIAELPGAWLLVVTTDSERAFKPPFVELARLGPAVACGEDEHVMFSEARGYDDGREAWRVVRDSSEEPYCHVAVSGNPPAELERIRKEHFAKQDAEGGEDAGVDCIFEIPPRLAQSICGFRIAEELEGVSFTELRRAGAKNGGFLQRLFGRR